MDKINYITSEQDILLSRESALASLSLSNGLELIRKYDFVKHGYATQAFFMLSIGLERLLKLIVIYNYRRLNQNVFPENAVLKKAGHNIKKLLNEAKKIAYDLGKSDLFETLESDPIYTLIVDFLTDFAHKARYYNLDILTGNENSTDEPLRYWEKEINSLIVERHYIENPRKREAIKELTARLEDITIVAFNNERGDDISSMQQFYLEGMTVETKQKYSMLYCYNLIRFPATLIWYLDKEYCPFISEYFSDFRITDEKYILSRKTWGLYKR